MFPMDSRGEDKAMSDCIICRSQQNRVMLSRSRTSQEAWCLSMKVHKKQVARLK